MKQRATVLDDPGRSPGPDRLRRRGLRLIVPEADEPGLPYGGGIDCGVAKWTQPADSGQKD